MLEDLCKQCNICWSLLPEPTRKPTLSILGKKDETPAPILVIDDCPRIDHYGDCIDVVHLWFDGKREFDYTTTIRCSHRPDKLSEDALATITSKCAVWTHGLMEGRLMILTTERGLRQLKIKNDHTEGDLFVHIQYGVILVIPPLMKLVGPMSETFRIFQSKINRALETLDSGLWRP